LKAFNVHIRTVLSFNSRLFVFQARNLEQKKEWTLQIKRVILENYNAVIPSHARQLVLQLGQTQQEGMNDNLTHSESFFNHHIKSIIK